MSGWGQAEHCFSFLFFSLDDGVYVPSVLFSGLAILDGRHRAAVDTGGAFCACFFCPCGLVLRHFDYSVRAVFGTYPTVNAGISHIKALGLVHGVIHCPE